MQQTHCQCGSWMLQKALRSKEINGSAGVALADGRGRNKEANTSRHAGMNVLTGQKIMFYSEAQRTEYISQAKAMKMAMLGGAYDQ